MGTPVLELEGVSRVFDDRTVLRDIDLVVAEFGWHKTGSITLLDNVGATATAPIENTSSTLKTDS